MPNDWFQFKQFTVRQDKCAMKVSTDACIQGGWAANAFLQLAKVDCRILDIGTGTGLLSLMLAQALPNTHLEAIELNKEAFQQACANFEQSPWHQQLKAYPTSLTIFAAECEASYDGIICNPPFFQDHLESSSKARNDARHGQSLSKEELAESVVSLLKEDGVFCVMYPASEWDRWTAIARTNGLHAWKQLHIQPTPSSKANRIVALMTKKKIALVEHTVFTIYDTDRNYTSEMMLLLKDYYLAF